MTVYVVVGYVAPTSNPCDTFRTEIKGIFATPELAAAKLDAVRAEQGEDEAWIDAHGVTS